MSGSKILLSLPRECVGKSVSRAILFDKSPNSLTWTAPDPRISPMKLMTSSLVLDPFVYLQSKYPDIMCTADQVLVNTDSPEQTYADYQRYDQFQIPLESQHISEFSGALKPNLKPEFVNLLSDLVDLCDVAMMVTSNLVLTVYGAKESLSYAQYKIFVMLNHFYGYSIQKVDLELSKQPLVAGPGRRNLLTLFQQTGVNVYMPPIIDIKAGVSVSEVYLAGDRLQLLVAEKILKDVIIHKTDCLEKECAITSFVRDTILLDHTMEIEQIMLKFGTFIQIPTNTNTVRVLGTTRQSIDNSINELVRLYSAVYVVELQAHFDQSLAAQMGALGINTCSTRTGTVLYASQEKIHKGLDALKLTCSEGIKLSLLVEQPLELMDFILGKKQGKINKVVNGTGTSITAEKCHDYTFRLRLTGSKVASVIEALGQLEAELPAEKSLYIPEVYHKQVIGQGGLAIQRLMRKYNVYMRFANTTKERYPNAFGDSRSDNVVIRCPAKNKAEIDNAAKELLQNVEDLAKSHHCSYVKLTRNHRRLLLETQSNGLHEIEVSSGAAIKMPVAESRETQLIEISGQTRASTETAVTMMTQLLSHTDYEFRVPWTKKFATAVGPQSEFNESVSVPLFLAMSAQVQAFEKVQLAGDNDFYSQIVVSLNEKNEYEYFSEISEVVTSYLRKHNLDIVDKGLLSTDLQIVTSDELNAKVQESSPAEPLEIPGAQLYCSPTQTSNVFTNRVEPQRSPFAMRLPTISATGIQSILPSFTDEMTARTLMPVDNWIRNFDETPVKRRPEVEGFGTHGQLRNHRRSLGRERTNRLQRRF